MLRISAGKFKNRIIKSPKSSATRPTSGRLRETVFNILQSEIDGAAFLDLFAGSGAMGVEAISRGASKAALVDNSRDCARCIETTIQELDIGSCTTLHCADVFTAIRKLAEREEQFDIIFADPPYLTDIFYRGEKMTLGVRLLLEIDQLGILKPNGTLFIEEGKHAMENRVLERLELVKARDAGRTTLWQYRVRSA